MIKKKLQFDNFRKKVKNFSLLKPGWDSYSAETPSDLAIKNCLKFLDKLEKDGNVPDWIEPSSDNSIVLEVTINGQVQEWDFYNNGEEALIII